MKRYFILILIITGFNLHGEVVFRELDLSTDNTLLFSARADSPAYGTYDTLFQAELKTGRITQLSYFPENVLLLEQSDQLQIQNRYGVFRTETNLESMSVLEKFPAFVNGTAIETGKINIVGASPDGMYLLYLKPVSYAYADLVLFDIENSTELVITEKTDLSFSGPGASWSPDSKFFIYTVNDKLYYFSIDQWQEGRFITEEFRFIGDGRIANVKWSSMNNLFYISGSLVYKILSAELFTRSLYSELMKTGEIIGKIPFTFDANFDNFRIAPDGGKLLFNKGGRNLFLYFLKADDYVSTGETLSLPYLHLPRNTYIKDVLWSYNDTITVLAESIVNGGNETSLFRIKLSEKTTELVFKKTGDKNILGLVLSGNEELAAVLMKDSVIIKDYQKWSDLNTFAHPEPLHAVWRANDELIIAGRYFTELLDTDSMKSSLICISQPEEYGLSEYDVVKTSVRNKSLELKEDFNWNPTSDFVPGERNIASSSFRVFLERNAAGSSYKNMVMIRNIESYGTKPLFGYPERKYEPFPREEAEINFTSFSHGSRIRRREVSIVFNAIDTVDGLTDILNTLSEYSIRCTFFLNGDFIRRNPEAVVEISQSGHEVGSLFYTYFNMIDSRYEIDKDFIKRGLARNEDEYFNVTGDEIICLWHAPKYFVNNEIISASEEMNYTYISKDMDPLDWISFNDCASGAELYLPSKEIVERILELKKPGSIIPVRIGETEKGRNDYLFHDLDLVLNGLISLGYDIVPVSTLMEHAK